MSNSTSNHFSSVFDFVILPIKILFMSLLRPRSLHRLALGQEGVGNSLTAVLWYMLYSIFILLNQIDNANDPETKLLVENALSIPFSIEILTIPNFLLVLLLVWLPALLLIHKQDRRDVISLKIIVLIVALFPYNLVSQLSFFPTRWQLQEATSLRALLSGDTATLIYFGSVSIIIAVLFALNIRSITTCTRAIRCWLSIALTVFLMISIAWSIQPFLVAFTLVGMSVLGS